MVQFRRVSYVIIIICLLAIDVTKADFSIDACTEEYQNAPMSPCYTKEDSKGDETRPCCLYYAAESTEYTLERKSKRGKAEVVWKAEKPDFTAIATAKCAELDRPFMKLKETAIRCEFACEPRRRCSLGAGNNQPCKDAKKLGAYSECIIQGVSADALAGKKCSQFTYNVHVVRKLEKGDALLAQLAGYVQIGDGTAPRKPFGGATEKVCAQHTYTTTDQFTNTDSVIRCQRTVEVEWRTESKDSRTVWLDYNKRYDNGNEYLFNLQMASLWLVSIVFVACACFCAGAIAFYGVQMAHRWISKDIKN